ncbi:KilA-N domain-containing protein [Acinetobacter sp. A3.8]|uniref:KilA-N domain-containing protein n=1 Tax=Acinetobacter sedimenti TaxID=2919922 RepID=A0A9X2B9P3_9GAMM|nr:KilA-N domain-containing protein [Acinetobacter sedimenti]MCJ8147399.1 KilA-N domain-containing protein [Acinetobacter sedimenti]
MKGLITSQYNGVNYQFTDDGWFNVTLVASRFNTSAHEWIRLPDTQKYIEALHRKYGKTPYLKTTQGNNGGTWLHPKLAVRFTQCLDIDFAIWCDEQIESLIRGDHPTMDVRRLRHQVASTYKAVCGVLQMTRQQQGKDTKPHHYMNEARLINWAMTGKFTGLDRDSLNYDEMDLLAELENQDLILIGCRYSYAQRKTALSAFAQSYKSKRLKQSQQAELLEW